MSTVHHTTTADAAVPPEPAPRSAGSTMRSARPRPTALARAAEGFAGANTTDDAWDAGLYQAELEVALDDLTDQASDFRAAGPETQQSFWEGVGGGLPIN